MEAIQTNTFSIERVIMLIKRFLLMRKKMILTGAAVTVVLLAVIGALSSIGPAANNTIDIILLFNAMSILTYVGGALSSVLFAELNKPGTAVPYLILPASSGEKLLAAGLISYIGFTIVGLISLFLFSLIIGVDPAEFAGMITWQHILNYVSAQSVFLFGSAFFHSNNFLNTFLWVILFFGLFALITILLNKFSLGSLLWFSGSDTFTYADIRGSSAFSLIVNLPATCFFLWMTHRRLQKRQIA